MLTNTAPSFFLPVCQFLFWVSSMHYSKSATTSSGDPGSLVSNMNQNLNWQIGNCLVEIDHEFNVIPELAESYRSSPDVKVWTFKLRKDIEFHNGKTMTSEDVIFSINHHLGENSKSAAKGYLKSIHGSG